MVSKLTKQERKLDRELLGVLIFLGIMVVLFLLASLIFKSLNRFEYEGLEFTKERFGEIPVFHHYYSFKFEDKLFRYNLFLRNDPRENNIPIEGDEVVFDSRLVFITLDTTYLNQCERSQMAVATLSSFLADNQFLVKGANMDFAQAAYHNQEYVTCENRPNNSVIQIYKTENETKIISEDNCFTIEVGSDCKILEAVERLEIQAVLDRPK